MRKFCSYDEAKRGFTNYGSFMSYEDRKTMEAILNRVHTLWGSKLYVMGFSSNPEDGETAYKIIEAAKKRKEQLNHEPKPYTRPDKHSYYLDIAKAVCKRSTCIRRQYGAVIVKDDEIIATGYNGAPRGEENCCDKGICWREEHNIPHGEQYEKCVGVHAEQNAIISARRKDLLGSTLYLYGEEFDTKTGKSCQILDAKPCEICVKMIKNAGIKEVIGCEGFIWSEMDGKI